MAFSGGGSNILKPHTHDSTILQDGGNLNFQNITQANMSAGSMTQSDGVHLQELGIGTPGQTIRSNAGATALEYYTPPDVGEDLINQGDIHGCSGGGTQVAVPVSVTNGDVLQADNTAAAGVSYTNSPIWYNSPAMELLASYTSPGGHSGTTLVFSSANLETDYSELIVVANLYTAQAVGGYGEIYLYPNGAGGTYTTAYGYKFDATPAMTAVNVVGPARHVINSNGTSTNSNLHSETHIALAKTATTVETIVMTSDSISDQTESQHWCNSVDRGTVSLTSITYQSNLSAWDADSNICVYGVKQ